jgi:RNA recognition motif-containing protein
MAAPTHQDTKTLWIGDIESWMDENYIANLFCQVGAVANVKIIRDKNSGAPMGYGFVEFTSHEAAGRVLQLFNGSINPGTSKYIIFNIRPFRLNWGYFGGSVTKTPGSATTVGSNRSNSRRSHQGDNNYQIYVGDLDLTVNKQQLIDHFRRTYNTVVDAKIIVDQSTKMSKGYGFVQFSNYEESKKALTEMQGSLIKGKPIKVSQGVSRNSGNQGSSNSKNSSSNSVNASFLNQTFGISGHLFITLGSPKGNILGGLGVQFKSPEGLPQSMIPIASPGYMHASHQMQGYQMTINPSMYGHPLVGQQALMYGYQHHGVQPEIDQSTVNRASMGNYPYQMYMPPTGMTMPQQAWQMPAPTPEVYIMSYSHIDISTIRP